MKINHFYEKYEPVFQQMRHLFTLNKNHFRFTDWYIERKKNEEKAYDKTREPQVISEDFWASEEELPY
jgi:hypothetical protein